MPKDWFYESLRRRNSRGKSAVKAPRPKTKRNRDTPCRVKNCPNMKGWGSPLCPTHDARVQRHGDPLARQCVNAKCKKVVILEEDIIGGVYYCDVCILKVKFCERDDCGRKARNGPCCDKHCRKR